jgi:hypothetical protein
MADLGTKLTKSEQPMQFEQSTLAGKRKKVVGILMAAVTGVWWAVDHYGRFLTALSVIKDIPKVLHQLVPFATPILMAIGIVLFFWDKIKNRFFSRRVVTDVPEADQTISLESTQKMQLKILAGESSRLTIHSAVYGTGPDTDIDVTEKLQSMVRDALVVPVANDLAPRDPHFGVVKVLTVEYSYGNPSRFRVTRPENSRLVLPEDTWARDEINKRREVTNISDSDPQVYAEFNDDRGRTANRESQTYITLVNRGQSEALNVCIDPISVAGHLINFPKLAYAIAPNRSKHRYPDIMTSDNKSADYYHQDLFGLFWSQYDSLGDMSIPELVLPLTINYQDIARNLYEAKCDLVFDPSAHFRVRTSGQDENIRVITARNHRFRRIALAIGA